LKVDVLVAEIGSTITLVNAFDQLADSPRLVGQGVAPTSVLEGDVTIGLDGAVNDLKNNLGITELEYDGFFATSSAAGGLKMSVHGLVYDMTVKAAKEAALGAGANLAHTTAGKLNEFDLDLIKAKQPNIILIAGGVDYGERECALHNFKMIVESDMHIPIIYAGNIVNHELVEMYAKQNNKEHLVHIVSNVYPTIDELNVEETRLVIQKVFEDHIIHAPGMEHIYDRVTENIMPTPGAVMQMTKLLHHELGDIITIDVGGATTDIHSITDHHADEMIIEMDVEPSAKRTVEGDLGVFVNKDSVIALAGKEELCKALGFSMAELEILINHYKPIPFEEKEVKLVKMLTAVATKTAIERHVGTRKKILTSSGQKEMYFGKDLTNVKYMIGTGGALTQLSEMDELLKRILHANKKMLLPSSKTPILIDKKYIMASLGVLSLKYEEAALKMMKESISYEIPGNSV
jgi:uncharacterized protein (TIGR01319 family)